MQAVIQPLLTPSSHLTSERLQRAAGDLGGSSGSGPWSAKPAGDVSASAGSVCDWMLTPSDEPVALTVMLMVRRGDSGEDSADAALAPLTPPQQGAPPPSSVVMAMLSSAIGVESCRRVVVVVVAAMAGGGGWRAVAGKGRRAAGGLQGGVVITACTAVGAGAGAAGALERRWWASSSARVARLWLSGKQRWVSSWELERGGVAWRGAASLFVRTMRTKGSNWMRLRRKQVTTCWHAEAHAEKYA